MALTADGVRAAAMQEKNFHPTRPTDGAPITAWDRRAASLEALVQRVNELDAADPLLVEIDAKLDALLARPF